MIGCGGRNSEAGAQALTADNGTRLVAMADVALDRVQETRSALKVKFPDQVAVDDDHCFAGYDGYKHVIESCDVVLIANAAKFHPMHMMAAIEAGKTLCGEAHAIDPLGSRWYGPLANWRGRKSCRCSPGSRAATPPCTGRPSNGCTPAP
jgi:hypothetical protein